MDEEYQLRQEEDGMYTVILGKERRAPSPEPASSPCPGFHNVTGLGAKEGLQGCPPEVVVVRSVHDCTQLNGAVIMGDTDGVQRILRSAKDKSALDELITTCDCSGSPAICQAAYHHQLEIMKLLLKYGGCVDTVNHLGLTPAHITAGNYMDNPDMMLLLIDHYADVNRLSKDGRSPLHIAAETGHFKIVQALLESGKLEQHILMDSYRDDRLMLCQPVILAAANYHYKTVNVLRNHHVYSVNINCDLGLISWSLRNLSDFKKGIPPTFNTFRILEKAIEFREEVPPSTPIEDYGNVIEIRTTRDVKDLATKEPVIVLYQSLSILERHLGLSSKTMCSYIEQAMGLLIQWRKGKEVELLLLRALRGMPLMEQEMISRGVYMMPSHLHITLSFFMTKSFWEAVRHLTSLSYPINYPSLLRAYMNILDTILELKKRNCQKLDHWGESFQNTLAHLLALFSCAIHHSCSSDSKQRREVNQLGFDLIDKYKNYSEEHFTSLLHFALRKASSIVEIMKYSYIRGRNATSTHMYIQLIEHLLIWGCNDVLVINSFYRQFFCKGERPLHMGVRLAEMDPCYLPIVNLLFVHGAHYDCISRRGTQPCQLATRSSLLACFDLKPVPLACLASQAIVSHKIKYLNHQLIPPSIQRYIGYHDQY